jgi:serine/threonine protein kinase
MDPCGVETGQQLQFHPGTYGCVLANLGAETVKHIFSWDLRSDTRYALKLFRLQDGSCARAWENADLESEAHDTILHRLGEARYRQWFVFDAVTPAIEIDRACAARIEGLCPGIGQALEWPPCMHKDSMSEDGEDGEDGDMDMDVREDMDPNSFMGAAILFVDGGVTLDEYYMQLKATRQDAMVLFILEPLFEALVAMREAGLMHNDIKPENIMVDRVTGAPRFIDVALGHPHIVKEYLAEPSRYILWPLDYFHAAGYSNAAPSTMTDGYDDQARDAGLGRTLSASFAAKFPSRDRLWCNPEFLSGIDGFMMGKLLETISSDVTPLKTRAGSALCAEVAKLGSAMCEYNVRDRMDVTTAAAVYKDICARARARKDFTYFECSRTMLK